MKKKSITKEQLLAENEDLRRRLEEAEETLRAIQEGEVDALVLSKPQGEVVFTLKGAESPYRVFVEAMNEGAATLAPDGTILFCNNRFAEMLKLPADKVIGSSIYQFIPSTDRSGFEFAFQGGNQRDTTVDVSLQREDQELIPVHLSFNMLQGQDMPVLCMVAMDLTEHKRLEETLRQFNAQLEKRVEDRTAELLKTNETLWAEITERKRAEEALRLSEEKFALSFANNPAAIAMTRLEDGLFLEVNDTWVTLNGYSREEAIGHFAREMHIWPTTEAASRFVQELRENGSLSGWEQEFRKKSGEVFVSQLSAQVLTLRGEKVILSTLVDITERKRAEEALHESEERLSLALDSGQMGLWEWDVKRNQSVWNAKEYEALGLPVGSGREQTDRFFECIHPEDLPALKESLAGIMGEGSDWHHECRIILPDGQVRWLAAVGRVFRDADGQVSRMIGVNYDITERKRSEEALRESEQRYRGIVETAEEGIATHDSDGRITYVNQRMANMLGYSREEIIGKPSLDFVGDEEKEAVARARQSLKEQGSFTTERKLRRKDGSILWTLINVSPRRDGAGNFVGYLAMHTDITARKLAEEALKNAHDELEKRVQERTSELSEAVEGLRAENVHRRQLEKNLRESETQVRFFAAQCLTAQEAERKRVAGELHDSIAASLGALRFRIDRITEEVKQRGGSPDLLQDFGSKVVEINNEVRRIMADLRPSILDDLGIVAALNWFCREYQKTYTQIHVESQIGISEDEVPDPLKTPIFRICQEAMNNTAKYGGGTLVRLSLRKEDDNILLKVQDNGQGFDLNTVRRGLGLSTMRERAQHSGGTFALESAAGKGTTIRVAWPIL